MTNRRLLPRVAAVAVIGAAALGGCSSGGTGGPAGGGATTSTATGPSGSSTYGSIGALHQALQAKGIACTLEYAGLRDSTGEKELSICTIDGEQAYLTVWLQPGLVEAFVASPDGATGTVAVGGDWTIVVSTSGTAQRIAAALGGRVPGAGTPATSTR